MGIFSKITSAAHTFAAYAEKELAKLYKALPGIETAASAILTYVGGAVEIIVGETAGTTAETEAASIIAEIQTGLIAAKSLVYDFGATPTLSTVLTAIKENLTALLTAGHITSIKGVSAANKAVSSLTALVVALTVSPAASTASTSTAETSTSTASAT